MPTYKGIPFNGGLASPPGTGAQDIVQTCQAICDWIQQADVAGVFKDSQMTPTPSADFNARHLLATDGITPLVDWTGKLLNDDSAIRSVDWGQHLLRTSGDQTSIDWQNRTANHPTGIAVMDWINCQLTNTSNVIQLSWGTTLNASNLPTAPGASGDLYVSAGVLMVS